MKRLNIHVTAIVLVLSITVSACGYRAVSDDEYDEYLNNRNESTETKAPSKTDKPRYSVTYNNDSEQNESSQQENSTDAPPAETDAPPAETAHPHADEFYDYEMLIDDVTLTYGQYSFSNDENTPDGFEDFILRDIDFEEVLDKEYEVMNGKLYIGDFYNGGSAVFDSYYEFLDRWSPEFDDSYSMLFYKNGVITEGIFYGYEDDGSYTTYHGYISGGQRSGKGLFREYDENGDVKLEYFGEYQNNKWHGLGRLTFREGANSKRWVGYVGEFADGDYNGYMAVFAGGTGENVWGDRSGTFAPDYSGYYENNELIYTLPYNDRWAPENDD
jgi:hypothetical protein